MADVIPNVLVPEIGDGIYAKCQRNTHMFGSNNMVGRISIVRRKDEWEIKSLRPATGSGYEIHNVYLSLYTSYQRNSNCHAYVLLVWILSSVGVSCNQRWRPVAGSRYRITFISARIHFRNVIPTAMFSGSNNDCNSLKTVVLCQDSVNTLCF